MSFLKVSGISVAEEGNIALKDISFTQKEFQKIAIAGETGSGKSTLLQTIAGLVQPHSGTVLFNDERIKGPHEVLVPGHQGIAYLSQQFELPQFLRVEQVLRYANTLTPTETHTLYKVCRINHLLQRKTNQLSGGERQRIALAKLLIASPTLLLLDEPYSNLDMAHKTILKNVINDISEELEITCLLISHDPMDTLSWADEILIMQDGRIIQTGNPEKIYQQPVNEYAAALFGNYNLLTAAQTKDLAAIKGIELNGMNLLIRPEHFSIVTEMENSIKGTITDIRFFGSYYELVVELAVTKITVRVTDVEKNKGDTVQVSLNTKRISYI